MAKNSNKKEKNNNKYNADNEIIIGVTTKPKEKVRVENKKATRTNTKKNQKRENTLKNKTTKEEFNRNIINHKTNSSKNSKVKKNIETRKNVKINKITNEKDMPKQDCIKKMNRKKIIISFIILLFIALCGTIYYLTTPVFNISSIEVYGNEKNTTETYISLSGIDIGTTNIFAVTANGIKKSIKENPYVENVIIERKLPNILKIHITERKISYQIDYLNNYIYIDSQGYILEINEEKKDVPVINGLSSIRESVQPGNRLIEEDLIKLNTVAKLINYCKYNTIENKITCIEVGDDTNYIVKFEKDKKIVYLGDASNLSERLSLLKTILKNEEDKNIEIFMDGDINKDDVYIRYIEK